MELILLVLSLPFTFLSSMASAFYSSCRCVRPGSLPGHRTGWCTTTMPEQHRGQVVTYSASFLVLVSPSLPQ